LEYSDEEEEEEAKTLTQELLYPNKQNYRSVPFFLVKILDK